MKFRIALLLTISLGFALGAQGADALSNQGSVTFQKITTISKAKTLIRDLYYGYQQAKLRGWSAHKKYILAHNYPGMYSNAKNCLDNLTGYSDIMPDLSSVSKDPNWKLPKGVYLNKLSGKKPSGETFVFQVTSGGSQSFNHVTILKGKAYFFLWVCVKQDSNTEDPVLAANRAYFDALKLLVDDENAITAAYGSVTGVNYTSDLAVYNKVLTLIPDTQKYIGRINALPTGTAELYELNSLYGNAWINYLNAFSTLKTALERQDATLVTKANEYLLAARGLTMQFVSSASKFKK